MVKPITPDMVTDVKKELLPDAVIEAWNEVIAKNWNGKTSSFTQDEIVKRIVKKAKIKRDKVFDKRYLDVEDIYETEGWNVHYDRPGYNETYNATFEFKKKME